MPNKQPVCVLQSSVLDFGKIIIYTSNLRIIKAPARTPEAPHRCPVSPAGSQGSPRAKERGSRRRSRSKDGGEKQLSDMEKEVMILFLVGPSGAVETLCLALITSADLRSLVPHTHSQGNNCRMEQAAILL